MNPTDKLRARKGRRAALTAGALAAGLLGSMLAPALALTTAPRAAAAEASYTQQVLARPGDKATVPSQAWYRIPALADLGGGVILASYDGRPDGGDSPSPNSILQRRSTDGGRTWGAPTFIARGQEARNGNLRYGFSDPSYIVDRETGNIFSFFVYSKDQGFHGSAFGTDDADRQVVSAAVAVSTDGGLSWSMDPGNMPSLPTPADYVESSKYKDFAGPLISDVAKPAGGANNMGGVAGLFAASGEGIQLKYGPHKGRLVQQFTGKVKQSGGGTDMQAYSVYSDDHGKTWQRGEFTGTGMDENKTVELSNGDVMMNSRASSGGQGGRKVAISKDGGHTYGPVTVDTSLRDPVNNASIARMYPNALQGSAEAKILLFSNANATSRTNGTIRYSCDDGKSWSAGKQFKDGYMAYSTVTALSDGNLGLLYEGDNNAITFAKFNSEWLGVDCFGGMNAALTAPAVSGANGAAAQAQLTVTNSGTTALSGATASFAAKPGWVLGQAVVPDIAPGASATVNVPFTIPASARAGSAALTARLSLGSQSVTANVPVTITGGATQDAVKIDVVGLLRAPVRDVAATPYVAGDQVPYTFAVQNLSNINVEVRPTAGNFHPLRRTSEGGISDGGNCGFGSFAVGQNYNCTTPLHQVTGAELADGFFVPQTTWRTTGGGLTDTLSVTGAEVDLILRKPSLTVTHTAGILNDVDASGFASVGDTVDFTSVVTNNGNVRITDITGMGAGFELAAGASKTATSTYTLTAADVAANKVSAQGVVASGKNGKKLVAASASSAAVKACADELCGAEPPMVNQIAKGEISIESFSSEELSGEVAPNGRAAALLDGDPETFWHSKWSAPAAAFPHSVVFDLGTSHAVSGFEFFQRQNNANGRIKDYELYVSNSPTEFGPRVANGSFTTINDRQRVAIAGGKAGRYVKLVALNAIDGKAFASGGEVNIAGVRSAAQGPSVSATPGSVEAGKDVSVSLSGFAANTAVALTLDGGIVLGSATTDADGNAVKSFTIPAGTAVKSYTLTATAGATSTTNTLVVVAPAPVLSATIRGERADADRNLATAPYAVGGQLPYNFVVKSTSPVVTTIYPTTGAFTGFTIEGTPNCRFRNVPANGGYTCTSAKRVVTAADVANGFFVPTSEWAVEAAGSATKTYAVTGDEVDVLERKPSMSVTVGAGVFADKNGDGVASVGDVVTFAVTAKNDGNVALTAVALSGVTGTNAALAVGASTVGSYEHTVTAEDLNAKEVAAISIAATAKNGARDVSKTGVGVPYALAIAPQPSATPTPTATPSATASATPTATASATATPTPTATPSATASATPTATASATASATPTATPSATASATPTATASATASVTPSATASSTPSTPTAPTGALNPGTVRAGAEVTVTGANFKPGSTATFTLFSEPVVLGTAVVAVDGTVSLTAAIPVGTAAGAHTIVIDGVDANGMAAEVRLALEVVAPGAAAAPTTEAAGGSGDLANTGFGLLPAGFAGGLLVLLGVLVAVRRKSAQGAHH